MEKWQRRIKMSSFNKLFYLTLSGEKRLNAVSVYVNKKILEQSGISPDSIIEIRAEKGRIIIEEVNKT